MSLDRPFGATSDDAQPPERKFTVRFNRRGSRRRGLLFYRLLEQAALTDPVTYRNLNRQPARRRTTTGATHTPPRPQSPSEHGASLT